MDILTFLLIILPFVNLNSRLLTLLSTMKFAVDPVSSRQFSCKHSDSSITHLTIGKWIFTISCNTLLKLNSLQSFSSSLSFSRYWMSEQLLSPTWSCSWDRHLDDPCLWEDFPSLSFLWFLPTWMLVWCLPLHSWHLFSLLHSLERCESDKQLKHNLLLFAIIRFTLGLRFLSQFRVWWSLWQK